jgi:hypothetical protein
MPKCLYVSLKNDMLMHDVLLTVSIMHGKVLRKTSYKWFVFRNKLKTAGKNYAISLDIINLSLIEVPVGSLLTKLIFFLMPGRQIEREIARFKNNQAFLFCSLAACCSLLLLDLYVVHRRSNIVVLCHVNVY